MIYGYQNRNRNPNSFGIDTRRLYSICGKKIIEIEPTKPISKKHNDHGNKKTISKSKIINKIDTI